MIKLKDILNKESNINEAKITAKQLRSDLSDYINKNSQKIAKEFIPKGTPYIVKNNKDGISFMIGVNTKSENPDYVKIDINLSQASGFTNSNYFNKAKIAEVLNKEGNINEGNVSSYFTSWESSTKSAAKKVDDALGKLIKDKKELSKLADLIIDLADDYAQDRIDAYEQDQIDRY